MSEQFEYNQRPASGFYNLLHSGRRRDRIWTWCPVCGVTTWQDFQKDSGIYEDYLCEDCGMIHQIAVR